ncbi:MAG: hypothetical protein NTU45_04555 [Planctomycetota bacterium]|nr:hypothetical protein [Planctomycetota bacterium]
MPEVVYNLHVEGTARYLVGACGVVVHNSPCSETAKGAGEVLHRFGESSESAARLARKAAEAEGVIGVHGVSVTARAVEGSASAASRDAVEQVFRVHDTPTARDPLHRTVELPKPVTQAVADAFNRLFGRSR